MCLVHTFQNDEIAEEYVRRNSTDKSNLNSRESSIGRVSTYQILFPKPLPLNEATILEFFSQFQSENLEFHARFVSGVSIHDLVNWMLRFTKTLPFNTEKIIQKITEEFSTEKLRASINLERKFYPESHPQNIFGESNSVKFAQRIDTQNVGQVNNTIFDWFTSLFDCCCCCEIKQAAPPAAEIPDTQPPFVVQNIEEIFVVISSETGCFVGIYDSTSAISEIIRKGYQVQSKFKGTTRFPKNAAFANIIGSTNDPKVDGLSWIGLWRREFGSENVCTSLNFMANCGPALVGGHVIMGTVAKPMPAGSTVFIIPICKAHNNNNNIWMEAITNQNAVVLSDYLR